MAEKIEKVQCQVCDKVCSSIGAVTHWKCTGHNLWRIILPDLNYIKGGGKDNAS